MNSLLALKNDAEEEIKSAKRDGKVIKDQATVWVCKVKERKRKYDQIHEEANSSGSFLSCITKRHRISTKVAELLGEIESLQKDGSFLAGSVARSYPEVKAVEHWPGPSIQDQTASVSEDLARVRTLLFDDNGFQRIGIWGMGGMGKTNLVRNLNNELENNSNRPFSCVLWVTVSNNLDIKKLQKDIAERLCLKMEESSGADRMAAKLHRRLKEERFLLILDDVWEKIDLDKLGVPRPEDHRGCKIILTSRSLDVCRAMLTDYEVKVSVLRYEDAWQLFSRYARDVVSSEHITPFAEAICRECKGLPLAIITMGAAMRGKTKPELWKDALNQLQRSVPRAADIEEAIYKPLKWSYDSLEGKDLKTCFLYCSLFPEDFSIEIDELVWCWLAEGLIDDRENYEDFYSRGISLIENLKDACLLEDGSYEGTVKMHDVVRDVSKWIACSEDGSKSLVLSGKGLKEISATQLSNSDLKRVSFMDNDLERLPDDSVIQCSEASTLLLQKNRRLDLIPERFLEGFEALRVLNISWTGIKSLPDSLLQLVDLRALLLNGCMNLEELPPLESLSRLQVLDLSQTCIRQLPRGLEQLSNLRHLNLRPLWGDILERLPVSIGQRHVIMDGIDLTGGPIGCWLSNASELVLQNCEGLNEMLQNLVINSVGSFKYLKQLVIFESDSSFRTGGRAAQYDLLPNLEELCLIEMEGIESISELVNHLGLRFQRLKKIEVFKCEEMKYLLSLGNSIRTMPNLEEIVVRKCPNLEELFNYLSLHEINMAPDPITPKLRELVLADLPKLRNLRRDENTWPGINVQVIVFRCNLLSTWQ